MRELAEACFGAGVDAVSDAIVKLVILKFFLNLRPTFGALFIWDFN